MPGVKRSHNKKWQNPRPSPLPKSPGAGAYRPRMARGQAVSGARRLARRTPERRSARRSRRPPLLRQPRTTRRAGGLLYHSR